MVSAAFTNFDRVSPRWRTASQYASMIGFGAAFATSSHTLSRDDHLASSLVLASSAAFSASPSAFSTASRSIAVGWLLFDRHAHAADEGSVWRHGSICCTVRHPSWGSNWPTSKDLWSSLACSPDACWDSRWSRRSLRIQAAWSLVDTRIPAQAADKRGLHRGC